MSQVVVDDIIKGSLEDLAVIMAVYGINAASDGQDSVNNRRGRILRKKVEFAKAKLEDDRDSHTRYQRSLGANRIHSAEEEVSENEAYAMARTELDLEIERVRKWRKEGLDHAQCVAEMHKFLEK